VDDVVYGPVDLSTVTEWIRDERVLADTWIYLVPLQSWSRAGSVPEFSAALASVSSGGVAATPDSTPLVPGIRPGMLRRIRIFSKLTEQQLGRLAQFMTVEKVAGFQQICTQGAPGDAFYAMLDGEVRARILVDGKETTLATFLPGDSFGELSLFDDGPRSADVITNADSTLLTISAERFEKLCRDLPDLATPILLAIGRTLAGRIRADNKRIAGLVGLSRLGH
jgi:hypothetical protein